MAKRLENFQIGQSRPVEVLPPLFPITKERAAAMHAALDKLRTQKFQAREIFNAPEERQRGSSN